MSRPVFIGLVTILLLVNLSILSAQNEFFPEEVVVSASALKMRAIPDINAAVVETLPRGTVVQVRGLHNNGEMVEVNEQFAPWYKVESKSGKVGYVFGAYVAGTYALYYQDDIVEGNLPPFLWYGVYQRDSFADELRLIAVNVKKEYSEMYESEVSLLKTDQKDTAKFIIGSIYPIPVGYAGPLGIMDSPGWFFEGGLNPGAMLPLSAGQAPGDTTFGDTYFLAATGCAAIKDNFMQVSGFRIQMMNILPDGNISQDLTQWFQCSPDMNPSVQLIWYGDIDHDLRPDAIIQDCPYEMGCRSSLFLSSKAKSNEITRKVCEHFWYGD